MSKSRCWLALVFLGSIAFLPMASWADAVHPARILPSICDAVAGNLVKNCGFEMGDFSDWTVKPAASGSNLSVSSFLLPHSGHFSAEFEALGTGDDSIFQVLSTTAGRAFHLSFFLNDALSAPAGEADFSASWDGTRVFSAPTNKAFGYTQFSFGCLAPDKTRSSLPARPRSALCSGRCCGHPYP